MKNHCCFFKNYIKLDFLKIISHWTFLSKVKTIKFIKNKIVFIKNILKFHFSCHIMSNLNIKNQKLVFTLGDLTAFIIQNHTTHVRIN